MKSRPYAGPSDLVEMQSIVTAAWLSPARPRVTVTVGDLEWWICLGGPEADWAERIHIWSEEEAVAWAWFNPPSSIELFVGHGLSPEHDTRIRDEILAWGIERIRSGDAHVETIQVWAADGWQESAYLLERGFTVSDGTSTHFHQTLDRELSAPSLPEGYRVRTLKGSEELAARVAVHRAAFAPSKMTIEKYEILIGLPHYSYDRDVVVTAPDGTLAAFTMCRFDPVGLVGEFEPVGTHPDHRGLGLAKAANLFGLRLLHERGARDAIVFSNRSNVASEALYRSAGFRELAIHRKYEKAI